MSGPLELEPTPPSEQEEEPLLSVEGEDAALLEDAGILADVRAVLKTSWLPALFIGLLSGLVATMVLVRDNDMQSDHGLLSGYPMGWRDAQQHARALLAKGIRYIPTDEEQDKLKVMWLSAETRAYMGDGEEVRFRALSFSSDHHDLPAPFYDSVHYGITAANPGEKTYTDVENREVNRRLLKDLGNMSPRPTDILHSASYHNVSGWVEEGYLVRFSFEDLSRQGYHGTTDRNGTLWAPATEAILRLGRKYSQWAVYQWYPYEWGMSTSPPKPPRNLQASTSGDDTASPSGVNASAPDSRPSKPTPGVVAEGRGRQTDKQLHVNVLQVVLPTRTGMSKLRSSAVVWRII